MSTEPRAGEKALPTIDAVLRALSNYVSERVMRGEHLRLAETAGLPPLDFAAAAKALAEISPDPDGDPSDAPLPAQSRNPAPPYQVRRGAPPGGRWARPSIAIVRAECLPDNLPSIRVLEKVGLRRLG